MKLNEIKIVQRLAGINEETEITDNQKALASFLKILPKDIKDLGQSTYEYDGKEYYRLNDWQNDASIDMRKTGGRVDDYKITDFVFNDENYYVWTEQN